MLARPGTMPRDEEHWAFEVKWDGVRAIVSVTAEGLRLRSRNGKEITPRYPELQPLAEHLPDGTILDAEVTAPDEEGRPSFAALQGRMHLTRDDEIERRARLSPVSLQIFDLLYLGGEPLLDLPYTERRARLEELGLEGTTWATPASRRGEGTQLLAATADLGLEGVIAKRLTSTYRPAARSPDWLKIKNVLRQELVIGGWVPQKGRRTELGALLVGFYEEDGSEATPLRFAGKVGTGFTRAVAADLMDRLTAVPRADSPFAGARPVRDASYVDPVLVAEVEFTEMTRDGMLRHPSFKGLRDDKPAREVVWELPSRPAAGG